MASAHVANVRIVVTEFRSGNLCISGLRVEHRRVTALYKCGRRFGDTVLSWAHIGQPDRVGSGAGQIQTQRKTRKTRCSIRTVVTIEVDKCDSQAIVMCD
jgi:hypothetical protein